MTRGPRSSYTPHMPEQETFRITPKNLQILCGDCVAQARIHWVGESRGFITYARIECHSVMRLARIPQMMTRHAQHNARLSANPSRASLIWDWLDYCDGSDLRDLIVQLHVAVKEAKPHLDDPEHGDDVRRYIRHKLELHEHASIVLHHLAGDPARSATFTQTIYV